MSKRSHRSAFRNQVAAALASVLAVGAGTIPVAPSVAGSLANQQAAGQAIARATNTVRPTHRAAPPSTGSASALAYALAAAGVDAAPLRGGYTPYEWGISRACARMRRKNRLHNRGLAHSKI